MTGLTRLVLLNRRRPSTGQAGAHALATPGSSEAGLTLLEALVAMLVITVTVSVITPPIFLATATRVSNRRAEQAMQLAQAEVERIRLLMLSSDPYALIDPQLPPIDAAADKNSVEQVGAPTTLCAPLNCTSVQMAPANLDPAIPVADQRFFIQTFREDGATIASGDVVAFRMGVRVYGSEALENNQPRAGLQTEAGDLGLTTGPASRANRPLVTFYTEMIRGTEGGSLAAMQNPTWD